MNARFRRWRLRRQIRRAVALLGKIDASMKAMNVPRRRRQQVWRDFYRSEEGRKSIIGLLDEVKI